MKNIVKPLKVITVLLLVSLVLVSCGKQRRGGGVLVSNCPAVGVIEHLNALTKFNGEGQTNKDVVFDAFITDVEISCTEGSSVSTNVSFSIRAKKGEAFQGSTHQLNYYVVIIRDNYQITNKKIYTTQVTFDAGSDIAGVRERFVQTFNNFEQPRRYDYEVLIGFEINGEELQFNVVR